MSYVKEKNGTYTVRLRTVSDGVVKTTKKRGFKTKHDAMRWYESNHNLTITTRLKFNVLVDKFLQYKKDRVKISSYYDLEHSVKLHILPYFSEMYIDNINKNVIYDWQSKLNKMDYSHGYKVKMRTYLNAIFDYGVKVLNIPNNPTANVENFVNVKPKKEMRVLDEQEIKLLIENTDNDIYRLLWTTLYLTGMRIGECLALQIKDIDGDIVSINKSMSRKVQGKSWALVSPKNQTSNRKIRIPKSLQDKIEGFIAEHQLSHSDFLFFGKRPLPETPMYRALKDACKKAGIEKITIHGFRHSHASLLIKMGEPILMVAKRLGHSDVKTTLNVYSHLFPNQEVDLVNKLQNII